MENAHRVIECAVNPHYDTNHSNQIYFPKEETMYFSQFKCVNSAFLYDNLVTFELYHREGKRGREGGGKEKSELKDKGKMMERCCEPAAGRKEGPAGCFLMDLPDSPGISYQCPLCVAII